MRYVALPAPHGRALGVWQAAIAAAIGLSAAGVLVLVGDRGVMLIGALAFVALAILTFEAPIVTYGLLMVALGLASEENVIDSPLGAPLPDVFGEPGGGILVYGVLALLATALAFGRARSDPWWPGAPATIAVALVGVALYSATRFGTFSDDLNVIQPLVLLPLAIVVGYWIAQSYSALLPLRLFVLAGGLATLVGLGNVLTGHELSFYDSSCVFLIGISVALVLFDVVELGWARLPFVALGTATMILSLRRGALIAVAVAIVVTALVKGRRGTRIAAGVAASVLFAVEIVAPGAVLGVAERLVSYLTGGSGQDYNVNYRRYETANAWLNLRGHYIGGIGPSTDWTLYRTFDGRFDPRGLDYLHNSYLAVWLRYSIAGVLAFCAFLAVTVAMFVRRSNPTPTVLVGGAMAGLSVALVTASFLTTTVRWPLTVGLLVGIALHVRSEARDEPVLR